jgi:threonine/homoserine/homoserine lactone efflux protein
MALPFLGLALVLAAHFSTQPAISMELRLAGIVLCLLYFAIRVRRKR